MKTIVILAAALLAGCTAQEQAQQQLIGGMQSGLKEIATAQQQRQELLDSFYTRRQRDLDDAFDQDVRGRAALDAEWVIEHRRAYLLGCESLWKQQQASALAGEQLQRNLRTIDEGLSALAAMSRMRQRIGGVLEGKEQDHGQ